MRRPRLFWALAASYVIIVLLCTAAVGWYSIRTARAFYLTHTEGELLSRTDLVREQIGSLIGRENAPDLQATVQNLGSSSATRITIVSAGGSLAPRGQVLADSEAPPSSMENHATRPEIKAAFGGHMGSAIRRSPTLGIEMMYVAIPYSENGRVVAAIRTAVPLSQVNRALDDLYRRIALSAVIVAAVAAAAGIWLSRRMSRQMRAVAAGAAAFAAGDFAHKLLVPQTREFAAVAEDLNQMAGDLDEKIRAITRERNEREAVLASMVESVLALDRNERVIAVNDAAARLLGVDAGAVQGRSIQELVRNPDLQRLVAVAMDSEEPVEGEVALRVGQEERTLQAHGTLLRDAAGQAIGVVVVLNDVTRLKRLEAVRRDFVANVSHELKTPVTSIKGFAETLLDGALEDPKSSRRFLRIIAGQADRLNAIIEDLLSLSSLERTDEGAAIALEEADVDDVVRVAAGVCEAKAQARGLTITVDSPGGMYASINPPLLEQAVVNLLDNAIKFSAEGGDVEIGLVAEADEVRISVRDFGSGIRREHLPRLFERFYRVDKARSRELGGTGLGLSIVKHIAQAHAGRVTVESTLGVGSTFTIHLPRG